MILMWIYHDFIFVSLKTFMIIYDYYSFIIIFITGIRSKKRAYHYHQRRCNDTQVRTRREPRCQGASRDRQDSG